MNTLHNLPLIAKKSSSSSSSLPSVLKKTPTSSTLPSVSSPSSPVLSPKNCCNSANNSPEPRKRGKKYSAFVLPIAPLLVSYPQYKKPSYSMGHLDPIKMYGVNSYKGLVKNYNEDRVSIVLNIKKPKDFEGYWPKNLSIFCVFDGHSGNACSNFLRDNFHIYLLKSQMFPKDIEGALHDAFTRLENDFLSTVAIAKDNTLNDKSGSCALVTVFADKTLYIANIGDSRAIMSSYYGREVTQITQDHKPEVKSEKRRIKDNEGVVYKVNSFNTLYRVLPGNLSVSRTIGDASSKVPFLGGKLGVIISTPEIYKIKLEESKHDFILMGCDGIYDKLDNEDLVRGIWSTLDYKESFGNNVNEQGGICADMAVKMAMNNKSKDNVSAIIIGFNNFEKKYNEKKAEYTAKSKTDDNDEDCNTTIELITDDNND